MRLDVLPQPVINCTDTLEGGGVTLGPITGEQIAANPMSPDVYSYLDTYTWNRLSQPVHCRDLMAEYDGTVWGIYPQEGDTPVGVASLSSDRLPKDSLYYAIFLFNSSERGKGYGSNAIVAITAWAMQHECQISPETGIDAVHAIIANENIASQRAASNAGYVRVKRGALSYPCGPEDSKTKFDKWSAFNPARPVGLRGAAHAVAAIRSRQKIAQNLAARYKVTHGESLAMGA
jgi:RimJ/RimL family protein N-acetyltransferase